MSISATTRGLRPGVCTSSTRPASPFDGQLIYETDSNLLRVWNGSAWKTLSYSDATNGAVLQVVSTTKTDTFSTASTSLVDITGLSATITPTSSSSVIVITFNVTADGPQSSGIALLRGSTKIGAGAAAGSRPALSTITIYQTSDRPAVQSFTFLDSPATTSATTYKLQTYTSTGTMYVNRTVTDTDSNLYGRGASTITVMEVAA